MTYSVYSSHSNQLFGWIYIFVCFYRRTQWVLKPNTGTPRVINILQCPAPKRKNIMLILPCSGCKIICMRLDQALVFRNLYPTRAKAAAAIKSGLVSVNGVIAQKASQSVLDTDNIVAGALPYSAGRGGVKLAAALDAFNVNPAGYVCLDVGASTGGFTETLLSRGAVRVIAVDVGTNQLTDELKRDARVLSLEQTDIRALHPVSPVDLIVIDVSFISLINIMDALVAWKSPQIIALIKPQFEVPRAVATRNRGVIKSAVDRQNAVQNVIKNFEKNGYNQYGLIESPIRGGSGNVEYLACWRRVTDEM